MSTYWSFFHHRGPAWVFDFLTRIKRFDGLSSLPNSEKGQKISKTNYLVLISSTKRTDSAQAHYSFSGGYENKLLICSWDFLNFRVCTTIFFMKFWGLSIKKPYPEENFGFEPQVTLLLKNQRSSGTIHLTFLSSSIAYTLSLFLLALGCGT